MYGYNGVDELTSWSVNGIQQRTWSQDALGNDLSSGTYSAANEETPTQGSSGYDAAGNMTTLQSGQTAKYDAWNRLAEVDDASGIVEKFAYDGTNRRIQTSRDFTGSTPATVVDDYLASQQVIESDATTNGVRNGGYQYIWSVRYIDAPILRDTLTTDGTAVVAADRVYYLSDANFNVTALVKYDSGAGAWTVAERYTYDPYGVVTYRNSDWTTTTSSANANTVLYAGRTLDLPTSLYYNRARYYDPGLERFVSRDPIGYQGGDANLYAYCQADPLNWTDPSGLEPPPVYGPQPYPASTVPGTGRLVSMPDGSVRFVADEPERPLDAGVGRYYSGNATAISGPHAANAAGRPRVELSPPSPDLVLGGAMIAGSFVPGVGEVMDAQMLVDPESRWWERGLAAASLGINYFTGGFAPNFGSWSRAGSKLTKFCKGAEKVDEIARGARAAAHATSAVGRGFKSFEALKRFLGPAGPRRVWHHIVEQSQAGRFGAEAIHNTRNVVAVSVETNRKVNALYSSIRFDITGSTTMTVRKWLATLPYERARAFGQRALTNVSRGVWP